MSTDNAYHRDLPSDNSPDDDALVPGAVEPDPGEVVGSDNSPRDLAAHAFNDPNVRETLDERLAEEEPDRLASGRSDGAVQLILGEDGEDMDADSAEGDDDEGDDGDLGAEEAAVHIER